MPSSVFLCTSWTFFNAKFSVLVFIYIYFLIRGKRFTVCTEIVIILGTVRFTICGGRLRYKRYDAHFLKESSVELPFSSFGDHLIHILRKVNRLIYAFKINYSNIYNFR